MVVLRLQVGVIYCGGLQRLFTKLFTLFFMWVQASGAQPDRSLE